MHPAEFGKLAALTAQPCGNRRIASEGIGRRQAKTEGTMNKISVIHMGASDQRNL